MKNQDRTLTELNNIGSTIAARLNEVGIFSEHDLRFHGAVNAHRLIAEKHPNMRLPVCYYLYSFEGALQDKHWNDIGNARKRELRNAIESGTKHAPR
ncbi:TfoX/Sxy family protein [Porticoccus sp. W117]|uniref:TfoX/Sxy family protein n=1 Tax=Porticoccus sp. W117 TaxID=3054777 RepID=UPI0025988432|nr:TfoX/Sxy family protein [Porticoccus sp. W117]MDM3871475.1 TfoX/Sxy family protein [Porticoccus sp. W117]